MTQRLTQYFLTLLIVAGSLQAGHSICLAQRSDNALARIKKIFVESFPSATRESQVTSVTRKLTKRGFDVVEDRAQADAILTGEAQAEIVLHGDGSVPDKSIFTYRLTLPNTTVVWKHRVRFVSKSTLADDYDFAARKIAEQLSKDREKSLRKLARS
ncbi:MAG TPA: hypothetical protein VJS64_03640 [Pyrinomonadaceae bacterium]|nr:hypothetical protein [Pyrinomonadaceae bacterium]